MLKEGQPITSTLSEAGYCFDSRLSEKIYYELATCPLGRLMVAATEKGLCFVAIGAQDEALIEQLEREFPQAELAGATERLKHWTAVLLQYLDGSQPHLELPLDLQITAFQARVYEVLCTIPYGQTATYEDVAKTLGNPRAVRAVARACATNPVSLVIPCHRVVRKNGSLAGYRWGIERKEELLKSERENKAKRLEE